MTVRQAQDDTDARLLEAVQQRVPIDHRPFHVLGETLGISEQECLERIERLKAQGVIRQVGAAFDPRAMGYQVAVVAMKMGAGALDAAAQVLMQHPGVSHVDQLNDAFNLWFAIAVPPGDAFERVVEALHALAQAEETIALPTARVYKAGSPYQVPDEGPWPHYQEAVYQEQRFGPARVSFTEQDIRFIRVMQEDLPLLELPYAVWAEQADSTEETLLGWAKQMEHRGLLRRLSAALSPDAAGSSSYAMIVWQVPLEQADYLGEQLGTFREVVRCCRRPLAPNWPYPLFTMIRASTAAGCLDAAQRIEHRVGPIPHKHLSSLNAYCRRPIRYFSPLLDVWRQQTAGTL